MKIARKGCKNPAAVEAMACCASNKLRLSGAPEQGKAKKPVQQAKRG